MTKALRYSSFILLVFLLLYGLISEDGRVLVRYDAYPIYWTTDRLLLISILILFSYICVQKISGGLWGTFTPTNTFLLLFLFLVMPGILLTPDTSDLGTYTFYSFWSAIMLFHLGLLVSSYRLGFTPSKLSFSHVYSIKSPIFIIFIAVFSISLISLLASGRISSLVFSKMANFVNENEMDNEIATLRQVGGVQGYWLALTNYMMTMFIPMASAFVLINSLIGKQRWQLILGVVMAIVSIILLLSQGGRLAATFIILFYFVAYSMVRKILFSQIVTIASGLCWLLIFQTIALGRFATAASEQSMLGVIVLSLNRTIERAFLVKGYVTQRVIEHFPHNLDYLYGDSYFRALIGQSTTDPSLAQEMFNFIFGGYNGTAGPQAFGEAYANFGLFGILIFAPFLGFIIAATTRFVVRRIQLDAFRIVFLAYFTVLIARIGYGEFFTFKANGMHILIGFFLIMSLFRRKKQDLLITGK